MHTGETERLPANLRILAASIIFTLISYAVFSGIWRVHIPLLFLFLVLALQTATILLGNRGVFTSMGAASVAVFVAIAAYFAAVFLLFPPTGFILVAGIIVGAASAIFVLASTVTSFRAGNLDLEVLDDLQIDTMEGEALLEFDDVTEPEPYLLGLAEKEDDDRQPDEEIVLSDPIDLTEGMELFQAAGDSGREGFTAYDGQYAGGEFQPDEETAGFKYRCRYRVIEAGTGNLLGIYYSDEGYSSIDPATLGSLLDEKTGPGELRIVNLDWSNFDEVEVQVEHVESREKSEDSKTAPAGDSQETGSSRFGEIAPNEDKKERETALPEGVMELDDVLHENSANQRYVIFERRTMRPLGEYVPEGERPRIDRLTLYRMFPEYDFRTFQIDSIRWLDGLVGIFIKGEKKKEPTE